MLKKNVLYVIICVVLYKMKIMIIYFIYCEINNVYLFIYEEFLVVLLIIRLINLIVIYVCSKIVIVCIL